MVKYDYELNIGVSLHDQGHVLNQLHGTGNCSQIKPFSCIHTTSNTIISSCEIIPCTRPLQLRLLTGRLGRRCRRRPGRFQQKPSGQRKVVRTKVHVRNGVDFARLPHRRQPVHRHQLQVALGEGLAAGVLVLAVEQIVHGDPVALEGGRFLVALADVVPVGRGVLEVVPEGALAEGFGWFAGLGRARLAALGVVELESGERWLGWCLFWGLRGLTLVARTSSWLARSVKFSCRQSSVIPSEGGSRTLPSGDPGPCGSSVLADNVSYCRYPVVINM